jgi:hypothetical protein
MDTRSIEQSPPRGASATIADIETLVKLHLRNRFVWLALGLTLLLIGQLSWWQFRYERFRTELELMGHITALIEAGLVATALICALATPRLREAWYTYVLPRHGRQFNYLLSAIAGNLTIIVGLLVLLVPVLIVHRYPDLAASELHISVPLMMLQRCTLLLAAVLSTYHVALLLRYYLRAPWWLAGVLGLVWQVLLGYGITYLSFRTEFFARLNDVFYYNQLWRYSDRFPDLQRKMLTFNMEQPYFAYYFSALLLWAFTLLLLVPQTVRLTGKEKP